MNIQNNIKTLAYFDIFEYPLTRVELETWQWQDDININVNNFTIQEKSGYYFLGDNTRHIQTRQLRSLIAEKKIARAKKFAKLFRLLPSVKMVAVCNSLGYYNVREASDIDFFIITAPGRIWLTRFWLQSFIKILKLRPYDKGDKKDTICLTFFLSSDNLNITDIKIDQQDVYLTYWITQLIPIYNQDKIYEKFLKANSWIKNNLPHYLPHNISGDRFVESIIFSKLFFPLSLSVFEKVFKRIQLKILPANLKQMVNKDSRVIMNDKMLKFHGQDDNRLKYKKIWLKKLKQQSNQ